MGAPRQPLAPALWSLALAACSTAAYDPLAVELPAGGLPADAFARCRAVLTARFRALTTDDEATFRLQTDWADELDDQSRQRRATVFRHQGGIGLVVELRYLRLRWFERLPAWSEPRPDRDAERDLGRALAQALQ
jgi:hypothetical protein